MHVLPVSLVAGVLIAAAVSYVASVTLGVLVATRLLDSSGFHWLHHALYVCTFVLAAATVVAAFLAGVFAVGWVLVVPLAAFALIPFAGTRGPRHPVIGTVPAPFYVAAFVLLALT